MFKLGAFVCVNEGVSRPFGQDCSSGSHNSILISFVDVADLEDNDDDENDDGDDIDDDDDPPEKDEGTKDESPAKEPTETKTTTRKRKALDFEGDGSPNKKVCCCLTSTRFCCSYFFVIINLLETCLRCGPENSILITWRGIAPLIGCFLIGLFACNYYSSVITMELLGLTERGKACIGRVEELKTTVIQLIGVRSL